MPSQEKVRSAVCKLWVSGQTRLDVSFHVSNLASSIKNATEKDFQYAFKIVKQLQNNVSLSSVYNLEKKNNENLRIAVYVDASLASSSNGGSQDGYLIFIVGENRKCSLLNWQSKRIKRVVRSSLSAETLMLCDALDDAIFLQQMVSELLFNKTFIIPIDVYTDNRSLYNILNLTNAVLEKQLRVDIAIIQKNFK